MDCVIYSDGAYSPLLDQGGVGILIFENGKEVLRYSNMYKRTTNNQMELAAVIIALRFIKREYKSIKFYTDSQYVIGCASMGWSKKKNVRLWKEFDKQMKRVSKLCSDITFNHIKGHQTDSSEQTKYNNIVDKLAVKASQLWK